jgi:uncharacterized protein (TIGR00255 family)
MKDICLTSMTGYGESSTKISLPESRMVVLRVQCKSVNHRFIDISLKMPSIYSSLEMSFQKKIREAISRGRIEVILQREVIGEQPITLHQELIEEMIKAIKELKISDVSSEDLIHSFLPYIWQRKEYTDSSSTGGELSKEEISKTEELLDKALLELVSSRKKEGLILSKEIESQLINLTKIIDGIEVHSEHASMELQEKLLKRLESLQKDIANDDPRILTEIALLADRVDIREEIVRAKAHIDHFRDVASEGGRKLDFLLQELVRECNTIGSKTSQGNVSTLVIDAKATLEKIKEQLQNVE